MTLTFVEWLAVLSWVACSIGAAGYIYPSLQSGCFHSTDSDRLADRNFAVCMGLLGGPVACVLTLMVAEPGRHGWSLSVASSRPGDLDDHRCDERDAA